MIKIAYPNFVNVMEKDGAGRIISAPTVELWYRRLSTNSITADQAIAALEKHIDNSRFEPTISDIINNKPQLSIYDAQRIEQEEEQLSLQEYHENNEVIPAPDYVHEMLAQVAAKMKAGVPKDE